MQAFCPYRVAVIGDGPAALMAGRGLRKPSTKRSFR